MEARLFFLELFEKTVMVVILLLLLEPGKQGEESLSSPVLRIKGATTKG